MQTKKSRSSFDLFSRIQRNLPPFIEGHRGVNRQFEQNTLLSFKKAIEYGLDSIELDVWLSQDKIPVVIHGGDKGEVEENTNGTGMITNILSTSLSLLRTKEMTQPIPTLEEVLQLCKDKIFINIEIKDPLIAETFDQVIKLVEKYSMRNQICISSFKHGYYDVIKNATRGGQMIEFGFLFEEDLSSQVSLINWDIQNVSINVHQKDITPELVEHAHKNNIAVLCWFLMKDEENDEVYDRLFQYKVDVICCNMPDKAMEFRNKYLKQNSIELY